MKKVIETKSGEKWKKRRLALTAAFHFAILSDFMEIFEKHALNLVRVLNSRRCGKSDVKVESNEYGDGV